MDIGSLLLVFLAFAAGGVVKGATGAGAPLFAVPLMAALRDVAFAVAVFVLPNIIPNLWQYRLYRGAVAAPRFARRFAVAGGLGAGLGTIALAALASDAPQLAMGLILAAYVTFRLLKPAWQLSRACPSRALPPTRWVVSTSGRSERCAGAAPYVGPGAMGRRTGPAISRRRARGSRPSFFRRTPGSLSAAGG